jgi:ABC-type Fe3+/spermidine/putrescine transport system ATPase subunit
VFQHYALFPHMSVGKNVEYGLKVRGVDGRERRRRALEALELVRMPGTYDREVGTLSGGERQRIALARAFVTEPALLLLDEPLGALDEKLRGEMQLELTQLRAALGVTFVYITHNQDEALTMSDRIAVLSRGKLEQVGTPREVYERPANTFVAQFMGATNLLEGRLLEVDPAGRARVRVGDAELAGLVTGTGPAPAGAVAWISVRPEHVRAAPVHDSSPRSLVARPLAAAYRGAFVETTFELVGGGRLSVREPAEAARPVHGAVQLVVDPAHAVVLTE